MLILRRRYHPSGKDAAYNPNSLIDVRLRKPHPQQRRELGPRVKSAFLTPEVDSHSRKDNRAAKKKRPPRAVRGAGIMASTQRERGEGYCDPPLFRGWLSGRASSLSKPHKPGVP